MTIDTNIIYSLGWTFIAGSAIGGAISVYKTKKKEKRILSLNDRIVKIPKSLRHINGLEFKYGEIVGIDWNRETYKINKIEVETRLTDKQIKEIEKELHGQYEEEYKQWEKECKKWEKIASELRHQVEVTQYSSLSIGNYIPQEPRRPQEPYPIDVDDYINKSVIDEITILFGDVELMPRGFDPVSETIIKKIKEKGVRNKKNMKMPRIFKYAFLFALVLLVYHFVDKIDLIANFLVHNIK